AAERVWAEQELASQYSDNSDEDGSRIAMRAMEREAKMTDQELHNEIKRAKSAMKGAGNKTRGALEAKVAHIEATLEMRASGTSDKKPKTEKPEKLLKKMVDAGVSFEDIKAVSEGRPATSEAIKMMKGKLEGDELELLWSGKSKG